MEITTARYINVNGSLLDLSQPRVMGILNVTPDSFYAGSRTQTEAEIVRRVKQIVSEGAAIIDIGAYSSRPNADNVSAREEMERLRMGLKILFEIQPDAVVSVDTFRADVARMCVEEYGVAIINDIAAGEMDVPYRCGIERTLYYDAHARHSAKYAAASSLRQSSERGFLVFCAQGAAIT